ncbi:hypothetical protein [Aeribacillus pallidus]|uniref:hypothetical protein n=1 Tax=Aeribacillus pallidus TaxID=33936 RepID=UPI003D1B2479
MPLLITILFLLQGISLFAIILLYQRQYRLLQLEEMQKKALKEIEEVFSSYLLELKEENDRLLKGLESLDYSPSEPELQTPQNHLIETNTHQSREKAQPIPSIPKASMHKAIERYRAIGSTTHDQEVDIAQHDGDTNQMLRDEEQINEMDVYAIEVIKLKNKGLTVDEIAQILNKGKTEVELLLKFRQNH